MSLTPHELAERGKQLVAAWAGGATAPDRFTPWHVDSPAEGRLRVHSRSRASSSLLWFTIPAAAGDSYDAVVLIEFDREDQPAEAWKLHRTELEAAATSETRRRGKRFLKVPVGGEWTRRARSIRLCERGRPPPPADHERTPYLRIS